VIERRKIQGSQKAELAPARIEPFARARRLRRLKLWKQPGEGADQLLARAYLCQLGTGVQGLAHDQASRPGMIVEEIRTASLPQDLL
jgi:hypothetical protein